MCEWGTEIVLNVPIPAELSHTGVFRWDTKGVDACIAPIVQALNDGGIYTSNSCCGHGKGRGVIFLHDGRVLLVTETTMNILDDLPVLLRAYRKEKGLTLSQLSERCGLSISYLSDIEKGRTTPSIGSLQAVFAALDYRLMWNLDPMPPDDKYATCKASIMRAIQQEDWASALLYLSGLMQAKGTDQ